MPAPPFPAWRVAVGVLTLSLVAATGLLFSGLWNAGWLVQIPRDFEPPGLPCRVRMPGNVREVRIFPESDSDGPEYAVLRRKPDEGFGLAAREAFGPAGRSEERMDDYLRAFFTTIGVKNPTPTTLPRKAGPARQASATTARYGNVVARVIDGGDWLYLLTVYGNTVTPERADVREFFDSLELTGPGELP